jgi:hypothetical protein
MSRGPRRKRGAFSLPAIRRDEIERHARYVGAADTDDFWRWLVAWCRHNGQNSRDPAGTLKLAAERMGGSLTDGEADAMLEKADALRQRRTAEMDCTAFSLRRFPAFPPSPVLAFPA